MSKFFYLCSIFLICLTILYGKDISISVTCSLISSNEDIETRKLLNIFIEKIKSNQNITINSNALMERIESTNKDTSYSSYKSARQIAFNDNSDLVIECDINTSDNIISITTFLFEKSSESYTNTFSIFVENDSASIDRGMEKLASLISNYEHEPEHREILYLENKMLEWLSGNKTAIIVTSDISQAEVFIDNEFIGITPLVIPDLEYGTYQLLVKNPEHELIVQKEVNIFSSNPYTYFASLKPAWLTIKGFPEGTEFSIEGKFVGRIPSNEIMYNSTISKFSFEKDGYYDQKLKYKPNAYQKNQINCSLKPKSKTRNILFSTIVPGTGQIYRDDDYRGYFIFCLEATAIAFVYNYNDKMKKAKFQYKTINEKYHTANEIDEILRIEPQVFEKYKNIKHIQESRNIYIYTAIGIWALNLIEAIMWKEKPRMSEKIEISLNKGTETSSAFINFSYRIK